MRMVSNKLRSFLEDEAIEHEILSHKEDFTALEAAEDTHTPGIEFAKTVVVCSAGDFALAVVPAHHRVRLDWLEEVMGVKNLRLATEGEMREVFHDCEVGAEPPFGLLYGLPTYVSSVMEGDEHITFNAGSHTGAIRMRFDDYVRTAQPTFVHFSEIMD